MVRVTQASLILTFLNENRDMEYTSRDISDELGIKFSTIRGRLSELEAQEKIQSVLDKSFFSRQLIKHYSALDYYRKILKLGASCNGIFRSLFALTFENNEDDREEALLTELFFDFPTCTIFVEKDLMIIEDEELEFGYSVELWNDEIENNAIWEKIETGED